MYYGGLSYTESWSLPVYDRHWWIERTAAEIKKQNEAASGGAKGTTASQSAERSRKALNAYRAVHGSGMQIG